MFEIVTQAARYGEQVRMLEDQGMEEDRARIRSAWVAFLRQLCGTNAFESAGDAYWSAYCR